jgi:hypothetical protein
VAGFDLPYYRPVLPRSFLLTGRVVYAQDGLGLWVSRIIKIVYVGEFQPRLRGAS